MGIYNAIYQEEAGIYRSIVKKIKSRYYKLHPGYRHDFTIKNFLSLNNYEDYPTGMQIHEKSISINTKRFLLRVEMKNLTQNTVVGFDGAERKRIRKMINGNDEEMIDLAGRIISKFRNKRIRKYGKKTELG